VFLILCKVLSSWVLTIISEVATDFSAFWGVFLGELGFDSGLHA
jgi:hypothetical protein